MARRPRSDEEAAYGAKPTRQRQGSRPRKRHWHTITVIPGPPEGGARNDGRKRSPASALVFLGLRLALAAADRGAEDVAKAGAGVGRAKLLHRPLLLVDLARLDRQRHPPGGPVDRGYLGVDALADRKAIGALLAAVARQLGFADEPRHAVGQRDLDAALGNAGDRAGHD